jgi:hypothetical protein
MEKTRESSFHRFRNEAFDWANPVQSGEQACFIIES